MGDVTLLADVANQVPEVWARRLRSQAENMTFWHRFEGPEGSNMPVIRKDDLEADAGDTIHLDIVLALTGTGIANETLMEGNEEKLVFRQISVGVADFGHAVRWGKKASILNIHNLRNTSLGQLRKWLAGKLDDKIFAEFTGGTGATISAANLPTSMKYFAGSATSIGTVADTDTAGRLKLDDISNVRAIARTENKVEPMKLEGGEEVYGLVLHDYAALALKKDPQWQQAQRDARERGADNPLFTGALGMWDSVILYQSPRVPKAGDGSGNIAVARNVFFGAQALANAWAYYPDWTEEPFSYGQERGVATYAIKGQKLIVYDLNGTETAADTTDDTAIGAMLVYSSAVKPAA